MLKANTRFARIARRWCTTRTELDRTTEKLEQQIARDVESKVKPLDYFGLSKAMTDRPPYPMVLLVGNHSSGKSTWVNHFIGEKVQRTGVAPVDDGFTVIMRSDHEANEDGPTLVGTPSHGFQDLAGFGPTFISHLKLKMRKLNENSELPQNLIVIDSPGMIGSPTSDNSINDRGYDLRKAMRWFAERADIIMIFFDPHNPGTTGETLDVLTESLSEVGHKSLILMNKVDLFDNATDFARAYGALCWHLSKVIPRKDIPQIYTTFTPVGEKTIDVARGSGLPVEDFERMGNEIRNRVLSTPQARIDNILTTFSQTVWRVLTSAALCEELRKDYTSYKRTIQMGSAMIACAGTGAASVAYLVTQSLPLLIVGVSVSIGLAAIAQTAARQSLVKYQETLLNTIETRVDNSPENGKLFRTFKPTLVEKLRQQELSELPRLKTGFFGSSVEDLRQLLKKGIPAMRDEACKARYTAKPVVKTTEI
ncbi:EH domain-containing protein 2 [Diplonema papillatum]|nr:EH domain-containing protein 2 [Diplonema papillatum]